MHYSLQKLWNKFFLFVGILENPNLLISKQNFTISIASWRSITGFLLWRRKRKKKFWRHFHSLCCLLREKIKTKIGITLVKSGTMSPPTLNYQSRQSISYPNKRFLFWSTASISVFFVGNTSGSIFCEPWIRICEPLF